MANCCAITYIIFSGIATILAFTACFVPILTIVNTNNDDDSTMMRKLPGSAIASHTQPSKRAADPESVMEVQCPVFSGQCRGSFGGGPTTSEFLKNYGCQDGLTSARALCVLLVTFTSISVLCQFQAISNLRNVRRSKISSSLTGSAGLICGVVGAYNQLNISQCLRNNWEFTVMFNGMFMVMISAIVIVVGCAFHFFSTLGMIASWCGCCGDQPGSYYNPYNLAPGQQGAAMYYNEQVPLNQQQPIVGSVVPPQPQVPLGYPQPGGYQQQPVGYAQQGGYQQQPTGYQQVAYPPQQQVYQQPQQSGYQHVSAQGAVYQQPPQQQQTYQQRFSTTQ